MGNSFFQSIRALFRLKPAQKLNRDYLISLLCAVLLAFLVGAGIMLLCGFDPIQCYGALFEGALGKPRAIGNTLAKAMTLALCGLAMSVAAKAGIFNVGGEGQLFMGALAAAVVDAVCQTELPERQAVEQALAEQGRALQEAEERARARHAGTRVHFETLDEFD